MTALVTLLREADDRLKGERTTEMGKAISSTRLLNLMALVGKVRGSPERAWVITKCRGNDTLAGRTNRS